MLVEESKKYSIGQLMLVLCLRKKKRLFAQMQENKFPLHQVLS